MEISLFEKLYADGIIKKECLKQIKLQESNKLFSVHRELKTLLYLGVLLLSGGVGILVYKNIDSIGHTAILLFIALVSAGSFFYCFKNKPDFSWHKVEAPSVFFDYILLLGCLTFITFAGYLQFEYKVFGNRFGLATFIPMAVLFLTAYYFDNVAILSLAITGLAAWAGIVVTPAEILQANDFNDRTIIITGLFLGILLIFAGFITVKKNLKAHFEFTYSNFGAHLLFISCIAAMLYFEATYLLWFVLLVAVSYFFYRKAVREKSFYFLLIMSLYLYFGLSYLFIHFVFSNSNEDTGSLAMACLFFIASATGLVLFLIKMNKKLKSI